MKKSALFAASVLAVAAAQASAGVITQWSFSSTAVSPPVNNPAPSTGTGTATPLGMTNSYTFTNGAGGATLGTGSVAACDILASTGVANSSFSEGTWRIRGGLTASSAGGNNNGWSLSAPQYTQGAEFDVSTVGFQNITVNFDWFSTNQGVRDLQEQYTLNGTTWTNINSVLVAVPNDFNVDSTPGNTIDLTAIPGANNNPSFGIRLVSSYDPTYSGTGSPSYTSATLTAGNPVQYNNNSGNWRFDNITFNGTTIPTPEPGSFALVGIAMAGLAARRRQRA